MIEQPRVGQTVIIWRYPPTDGRRAREMVGCVHDDAAVARERAARWNIGLSGPPRAVAIVRVKALKP